MRYYLGPNEGESRVIYDEKDGMPAITVEPQAGVWTADRQALLDAIMKAFDGS